MRYSYGAVMSCFSAEAIVMGIERMHTPTYWRKRAEEFRTKADNLEHKEARDSLLRVAVHYERSGTSLRKSELSQI